MVLAGAFVANAQPGGGFGAPMDPAQIAKFRADDMKQAVKLTDAQYTKVVDLFKAEMEEMQKQREEQQKKLQAILTKDQFEAWTKHEREMMERMMSGGFGGPGGPGPR